MCLLISLQQGFFFFLKKKKTNLKLFQGVVDEKTNYLLKAFQNLFIYLKLFFIFFVQRDFYLRLLFAVILTTHKNIYKN